MDNREVALELLKLYLQLHRERMGLDELVAVYLRILDALERGRRGESAQPDDSPQDQDDDTLFDFKDPLSVSDRDA
ncbi:MAG TPA: hypothetical protein EYH23_01430 [Euryarchaeota archaeon]|nr:hypothetical protein [Euryarchaeota archaeon]